MALTPEEEAEANRLAVFYNEGPNSATNPGGFGRGGNSALGLFIAACRDISGFGRGVVRVTLETLAEIRTTAARFESAVAAIREGPVSSVQVGDGPAQVGAVVIDLSTLSAQVEASLGEVRDAQAALEASTAALRGNGAAYSLAFGG